MSVLEPVQQSPPKKGLLSLKESIIGLAAGGAGFGIGYLVALRQAPPDKSGAILSLMRSTLSTWKTTTLLGTTVIPDFVGGVAFLQWVNTADLQSLLDITSSAINNALATGDVGKVLPLFSDLVVQLATV